MGCRDRVIASLPVQKIGIGPLIILVSFGDMGKSHVQMADCSPRFHATSRRQEAVRSFQGLAGYLFGSPRLFRTPRLVPGTP